jgi:hypothetical protein
MRRPRVLFATDFDNPAQDRNQAPPSQETSSRPALTATGLLAGIFALYLALVPLGQWQPDEYDYFSRLRAGAGQAFLHRLRWSPRPIGETLYLAYGLVANHVRLSLSGWFLGFLWVVFLLCASATALSSGEKTRRLYVFMMGLAVATACITSGPVFQVFYWPAGAVAYLTTLSATLLVFLHALDGRLSSSRERTICCVALLVAALSSEMGALFVLCFALFQAVMRLSGWTDARREDERSSWWILPGAASAAVLLWIATHRLPVSETAFTVESASLHNPLQSALSASARLVAEAAGWTSGIKHPGSALLSVIAKVALGVGAAILLPTAQTGSAGKESRVRSELFVLAATILSACFLGLFASYLHFGYPGGERYETLRRCWILMAYIALAVALRADSLCPSRARLKLGPVLLIAGVVLPWHVSPLARQYAEYAAARDAIKQTFQSGYQPGGRMVFVVPPTIGVITPATLAPGTYTRTSELAGLTHVDYILKYFGKQELLVTEAQRR